MVDINKVNEAKKEVSEIYNALKPIVKETVDRNTKDIDAIIAKIKNNLTTLTNKELQDYMLQLSIELYYFSERKDMSLLMQECAV